jgi:hypothetical protein
MRRLTLAFALFAACAAQANDQVRVAPPFMSIGVKGPISVTVEAGATQSITVRGDDKFVKGISSEVVNGELRLRMPDNTFITNKNDQRIIITMPELRAFNAEGAGEIKLKNIHGDRLDVSFRGAGSMDITGAVRSFRMNAEGVGQVDTKALIANNVDIRFQGIGDVKVYAKDKLDVVVQGMGNLTYFGKPHTVNKSVAGLGNVSAGD